MSRAVRKVMQVIAMPVICWGWFVSTAPANSQGNGAGHGTTNVISKASRSSVDRSVVQSDWMTLPRLSLIRQVESALRCGAYQPRLPLRKCNILEREPAFIQAWPDDGLTRLHGVEIWNNLSPRDLDPRHPGHLPRAPFEMVHYLLPHWRGANRWLTHEMYNWDHYCGRKIRVGNAWVHVSGERSKYGMMILVVGVAQYQPSAERYYAECRSELESPPWGDP